MFGLTLTGNGQVREVTTTCLHLNSADSSGKREVIAVTDLKPNRRATSVTLGMGRSSSPARKVVSIAATRCSLLRLFLATRALRRSSKPL